MRNCSNCGKAHGPLKRYMWNINYNFDFKEERLGKEPQRKGKPVLISESGLLCDVCAKKKGAWQTQGQDLLTEVDIQATMERGDSDPLFDGINDIIDSRTN